MDSKEIKLPEHYKPPFRCSAIPYHIRRALPWWIRRPYDWVADRLWRRHHILKLSYGYGWYDVSSKVLYALFDLLTEFMEKEKPGNTIEWNSDPDHAAAWAEIQALYHWWKVERPGRKDPLEGVKFPGRIEMPPNPDGTIPMGDYAGTPEEITAWKNACGESNRLEIAWETEDEFMMMRLIKIRRYLWT